MMWVGKTSINLIFQDERLLNANCCLGFFFCLQAREYCEVGSKERKPYSLSVLKWVNVDILQLFADDIPIFYVRGFPPEKIVSGRHFRKANVSLSLQDFPNREFPKKCQVKGI